MEVHISQGFPNSIKGCEEISPGEGMEILQGDLFYWVMGIYKYHEVRIKVVQEE